MVSVSEILDTMDDLLEKAWNLPLTGGKCVVDIDRLQDLIGDVRLHLPKELKQAKLIVADRQDILNEANKEAAQIIEQAKVRAKQMTSEDEIVKQAQARANQMVKQAHDQAQTLKQMTNDFVESLLGDSETALAKTLQELKGAHQEIKKAVKRQ